MYRLYKMFVEETIDVEQRIASGFHFICESVHDMGVDAQACISQ